MRATSDPDGDFTLPDPNASVFFGASSVTDLIVAVLGTAGILLMAGYAALCERI
jgi:hypothetical protein